MNTQLIARVGGGEWQQRQVSGALNGCCEPALVARAGAGAPARQDFAAVGDIALEPLDIFVVGGSDLIDAEAADFATRNEFAPPARAAGATRATPAPSSFAIVIHSI
jgi:hypothetical protein